MSVIYTYQKPFQTIQVHAEGNLMWCTILNRTGGPFSYRMTHTYDGTKTHNELIASGYKRDDELTDEDLGL